MKRTIIGIALLISATLLDIGIIISGAIITSGLTQWDSVLGKYWTAITENNLMIPLILVNILFVLSLVILKKEYFDKTKP